ncbi:unnamed protein product [Aureobasidium mustum]|uniref:Aminoglycoside phosphotransferase domain-containing protein n=1 Tax=Aureobasidium mustum TaxID=2773714 RepID=A0A9N8KA25_9PEZI|nr:unnamed protein product [Aureobasidium mustum]
MIRAMTRPSILTKHESLTEQDALDIELDVIPQLQRQRETDDFRRKLQSSTSHIRELISRHLQIPESDFVLDSPSAWKEGSFNICLGFDINNDRHPHLPQRALIRFPLPFNIGGSFAPGIMDEKLRCEAATYIWVRENCANIPIPRLLGMGFPGSQTFTAIENETFLNRFRWYLRYTWNWLHGDKTSPYSTYTRTKLTDVGYLLLEWVPNGRTVTDSWLQIVPGNKRTANLYRGIARIMLDLANVPLPKIGSWTMDNKGVLTLTNQPLLDLTLLWNQYKVPTGISRSSGSSYDPSDEFNPERKRRRSSTHSIGRHASSSTSFFNKESREGPFVLFMSDLHPGNIFVDDDWNIVSIIDLELCPAAPIQMTQVPHWLTVRGVDQITGPHLDVYKQHYDMFVNILEQEEKNLVQDNSYSQRLRHEWETGRFWYVMALRSINAFPSIFEQHLQPRFFEEGFETHVQGKPISRLWCEDVDSFIVKKLQDYEVYKEKVRSIFAAVKTENGDAGEEERGEERIDQQKKGEEETSLEKREEVDSSVDTQHNPEQEAMEAI